jgi:cobalamin biosynthesis protein CobD/CbiB
MAGALNVQLEKQGHYIIGDRNSLSPIHIKKALHIMLLTATLFAVTIVVPVLALKTLLIP